MTVKEQLTTVFERYGLPITKTSNNPDIRANDATFTLAQSCQPQDLYELFRIGLRTDGRSG